MTDHINHLLEKNSDPWEEIKKLRAHFIEIQKTNSNDDDKNNTINRNLINHLTEDHVVEIISKLNALNLIPSSELIFTLDGKEFVTRTQLRKEIANCMGVYGGRMSKEEMVDELNVSWDVLERELLNWKSSLSSANNEEVHNSSAASSSLGSNGENKQQQIFISEFFIDQQGEIMSQKYLSELNQKIFDIIEEKRIVTLEQICQSCGLLSDVLLSKLGPAIENHDSLFMSPSRQYFYSKTYLGLIKGKLKGRLTICMRPLSVKKLFEDLKIQNEIGKDILLEIQDSVPGVILGKDLDFATYIPTLYQQHQENLVRSVWSATGLVHKKELKKITNNVATPLGDSFVSQVLKEALPLDRVYISQNYIQEQLKTWHQHLRTHDWIDLEEEINSSDEFSLKDLKFLVESFQKQYSTEKWTNMVGFRFLVSEGLLRQMHFSVESFVRKSFESQQLLQQRRVSRVAEQFSTKRASLSLTNQQIAEYIHEKYPYLSNLLIEELSSTLLTTVKSIIAKEERTDKVFLTPTTRQLETRSETQALIAEYCLFHKATDHLSSSPDLQKKIQSYLLETKAQVVIDNLTHHSLYQSLQSFFEQKDSVGFFHTLSMICPSDQVLKNLTATLIQKLKRQLKSSQLDKTQDDAFILHLAILLFYYQVTGCIVHASGKFVPGLLKHLQTDLKSIQIKSAVEKEKENDDDHDHDRKTMYQVLKALQKLILTNLKEDTNKHKQEMKELSQQIISFLLQEP